MMWYLCGRCQPDEDEAMGFDYLARRDYMARVHRARGALRRGHIDFGFGGSSTNEMLTAMDRSRDALLARVCQAGRLPTFVPAACSRGAFGESA
jgi:hypothetical protein